MSAKWKHLITEIYYISCPQSGKYAGELYYCSCPESEKVYQERPTIFTVHKVQNFDWRTVRYFTSTKWKSLTGEAFDILSP